MKVYGVIYTNRWDSDYIVNEPLFRDKAKAEQRAKELMQESDLCRENPNDYFYIVEEFDVEC